MKSIKLPFAYNEESDHYYHISEDINSDIKLVCPFCKNPVGSKKGKIRRHHFYHLNNKVNECPSDPETVLHEGSKIYLYKKLKNHESFDISLRPKNLLNDSVVDIFNNLKINEIIYSSSNIINNDNSKTFQEHYIDKAVPDVFTKYNSEHALEGIAWEICVTHPIEEDKINFYKENKIAYIELIPSEKDLYDYQFEVRSYSDIELFSELKNLKNDLYTIFKEDIFKQKRKKKKKVYKDEIKEKITKNLFENIHFVNFISLIRNSHLTNKSLSLELKPLFDIHFQPKLQNQYKDNSKVKFVSCQKLDYYKNGSIRLNNRYFLDSNYRMLSEIYETLNYNYLGGVILNSQSEVVGFKLFYPDFEKNEVINNSILLENEIEDDIIFDVNLKAKRAKKGFPYLTVKGNYLKKPITQLMNILGFFYNNFEVSLGIRTNTSGYETSVEIKISNLPSEKKLENYILDNIYPQIISRIKRRQYN